eukprot:2675511-Prymnesium_polylepis.1
MSKPILSAFCTTVNVWCWPRPSRHAMPRFCGVTVVEGAARSSSQTSMSGSSMPPLSFTL